jgi:uncharacterized membrane protein YedE/YeeE
MKAAEALHGLATGVAFGVLLQKSGASDHRRIVDQLLLRDWSVADLMGGAIATGAFGVEALRRRGAYRPEAKPMRAGVLFGAALFGTGMALLGYCPGTCVAAAGEGKRDAAVGVLGMFAGALAFVRAYPALKPLLSAGDLGKRTLPRVTHTSPLPWAGAVAAGTSAAVALAPRST